MSLHCGIIGLPNVGKSTLFNALTAAGAEASNYPFCTINPNVGVVRVPDPRLETLAGIYHPQRVVPSTVEFVDIAGLVRGASKGEGLGNQFLSHIREADALVHVVRCFDDPLVAHVDGTMNAVRDIETVETELLLKDLDTVEKSVLDAEKRMKGGDRKAADEAEFCSRMQRHIAEGKLARLLRPGSEHEVEWLRALHLLTAKPVMYVCNVDEKAGSNAEALAAAVCRHAENEGSAAVKIVAALEAEVAELPEGERREYLEGLGVRESGLARVITGSYELLGLITFFTVGPKEVRAWTLPRGCTAAAAAGTVHSDFERGFIRAEIMKFRDLARLGSEQKVKEAGALQAEGKEYIFEDGDIAYFRFNV